MPKKLSLDKNAANRYTLTIRETYFSFLFSERFRDKKSEPVIGSLFLFGTPF